jgi:hypothetical protein
MTPGGDRPHPGGEVVYSGMPVIDLEGSQRLKIDAATDGLVRGSRRTESELAWTSFSKQPAMVN